MARHRSCRRRRPAARRGWPAALLSCLAVVIAAAAAVAADAPPPAFTMGAVEGRSAAPLMQVHTLTATQPASRAGVAVTTIGDVNGDGLSDYAIGAPLFDSLGVDEGRVYVYFGPHLDNGANYDLELAGGAIAGQQFGAALAPAGDVNGDGYADFLVGAPGYSNGEASEGRIYLYLGSAAGPPASASWSYESNAATAALGSSVNYAGDVNGDGYDDVIAGAPSYDGVALNGGLAVAFYGSPSGLPTTPSWSATGTGQTNFGTAVAPIGDVNGDGYDDVIVGAPQVNLTSFIRRTGRAYVYYGSASGLAATAATAISGGWPEERLGTCIAGVGDVNGDGYPDVLIGAPRYENTLADEGAVRLYLGGAAGLSSSAVWAWYGGQASAQLCVVGPAGDIDGDGYADFTIGAPLYDVGGNLDAGATSIFLGNATGIPTFIGTYFGPAAGARMGTAVGTVGDFNGDGHGDVVFGVPYDGAAANPGGVMILPGASYTRGGAHQVTYQNFNGPLGAGLTGLGDLLGDGAANYSISAPTADVGPMTDAGRVDFYHSPLVPGGPPVLLGSLHGILYNESFGLSVARAGDVNQDGHADVLIGAPYYSSGGRAAIYAGSATGVDSVALWQFTLPETFAQCGLAVAFAGDVNGDGYGDVLVGAPGTINPPLVPGRVFLFYGQAGGMSPTPAWSYQSPHESSYLGCSLAGGADFNGDGYSDFAVGASQDSSYGPPSSPNPAGGHRHGTVDVFLGGPGGPPSTPSYEFVGTQPGVDENLGLSLADVGDVYGDGRPDLLISSWGATGFQNGSVRLVNFTSSGYTTPYSFTSPLAGEEYGFCIAGIGDMNGDGYSDYAVGSANYYEGQTYVGKATIYYGSSFGPTYPDTLRLPGFPLTNVGGGIDLDQDGFNDLLVSQVQDGQSYYYLGNRGGKRSMCHAYEPSTIPPLSIEAPLSSRFANGFGVRSQLRSAAGVGRLRMRAQAYPVPGGPMKTLLAPLGRSIVAGGDASLTVGYGFSDLASGTPYRWRARAESRFPYIPWTMWRTPPDNDFDEADVRTPAATTAVEPPDRTPRPAPLVLTAENPFRERARLWFDLPRSDRVRLEIFDANGRRVATVADGMYPAGHNAVEWKTATSVPPGLYLARLERGGDAAVRKLVRLK